MKRWTIALATIVTLASSTANAADLVRVVKAKIAAGDLYTGAAVVEDYRKATGVDAEYLDAVAWLARGAEMLRRPDLAAGYVAELHREIPVEKEETLTAFGAAIEVEGRLIAARDGRGAAIRYFDNALAHASAASLRSRISKNINMLSMEGEVAPPLDTTDFLGTAKPSSLAALRGKPVLLFFWANWCGDCKAQSAPLARVWEKYRAKGLQLVTATRYYGTVAEKPATPAEEKAQIEKVWNETYPGLAGAPVVISTDTMVRYGASATPTFALIDRKGVVRLYTATRLSEAELSRRIEEVLAEAE
jgi:thiol-disulfide isomerase/thioredoxin